MNTHDQIQFLITHLLKVETPAAMEEALSNLLTPAEFLEVANRLQIITMIEAGIPQRKIAEELGVGIATVSRGARVLKEKKES